MKKILLLLLFSGSVMADISSTAITDAGFNKLSEAQKAELIQTIATKANTQDTSPEVIEKWTQIGTQVAQGLGAAAKELNVSVNDFAKTPVGQLTTVLIVWHIIGHQLMHIIGAMLFWFVGYLSIRYVVKKANPDSITYSTTDKNIFGNYVITNVRKDELSSEFTSCIMIAQLAILCIGILIFFN